MSAEGPAAGTLIGGKFKVLRTLGAGGMGAVYEIEHVFTHHRRALKLLHREVAQHPHIVERFLREASAAGRIGNPHIVETFDAGRLDSGEPYLVMELLNGQELTQQIAARGKLGADYLAHLVRQACSGIQAAHDAGVVHRDLKPDNLFVTERDGRPFVKILDFGISKFDSAVTGDHAMTREGSILGTPYYMPPEQVRGAKDLDARADVYALGSRDRSPRGLRWRPRTAHRPNGSGARSLRSPRRASLFQELGPHQRRCAHQRRMGGRRRRLRGQVHRRHSRFRHGSPARRQDRVLRAPRALGTRLRLDF
jgi:serine/threonine protein kinase